MSSAGRTIPPDCPAKTAGAKIDYIVAPAAAGLLRAAIVRTARAGRLPSDHFRALAHIRLPPGG